MYILLHTDHDYGYYEFSFENKQTNKKQDTLFVCHVPIFGSHDIYSCSNEQHWNVNI